MGSGEKAVPSLFIFRFRQHRLLGMRPFIGERENYSKNRGVGRGWGFGVGFLGAFYLRCPLDRVQRTERWKGCSRLTEL